MSPSDIHAAPPVSQVTYLESEQDSKKEAAYNTNVLAVDPEHGDDEKHYDGKERYDMIIPEGVDPELMPHEDVRRGLKQRHIQVSI